MYVCTLIITVFSVLQFFIIIYFDVLSTLSWPVRVLQAGSVSFWQFLIILWVFFALWLIRFSGTILHFPCPILQMKINTGTSLVVQWLKISFANQGIWVWSLVWELRSYMPQGKQACAPQLESLCTTLLRPPILEPMHKKRSPHTKTSEAHTHHN